MTSRNNAATTMLLLQLLLLVAVSNAYILQRSTKYINIKNEFNSGKDLTLHCKSADDDLGEHLLHRNDYNFFKFRPNLWGTTQFYCSVQWDNNLKWFDAYIDHRDRHHCHDFCFWSLKEDGPCLNIYTTPTVGCLHWNDQ